MGLGSLVRRFGLGEQHTLVFETPLEYRTTLAYLGADVAECTPNAPAIPVGNRLRLRIHVRPLVSEMVAAGHVVCPHHHMKRRVETLSVSRKWVVARE